MNFVDYIFIGVVLLCPYIGWGYSWRGLLDHIKGILRIEPICLIIIAFMSLEILVQMLVAGAYESKSISIDTVVECSNGDYIAVFENGHVQKITKPESKWAGYGSPYVCQPKTLGFSWREMSVDKPYKIIPKLVEKND